MDIKRSITYLLGCITLTLVTHGAIAQSFAIEAGKKDINLAYANADAYDNAAPLVLDAQLLYSKQNNHQDVLASIGLAAFTDDADHIKFGAGIKIIAADPLDYYLGAIAIGVELDFRPATIPALKFETSLYYAGEALTFSDGENIALLMVNMDYEIARDTFVRLGYRRIKSELNNNLTTDFDRGAYLGLLWAYK